MTDHELQLKAIHLRKKRSQRFSTRPRAMLAEILAEAFGNYFGWVVYRHE